MIPLMIREATVSDIDPMIKLLTELFSIEADFTIDPIRQRRGLHLFLDGCGKHRCMRVAETGGRVVGMCTAQTVISTAEGAITAWIEDLVVDETYRRQGIGCRLIRSVEAWARARGIRRLQLLADRDNLAGLGFYAHHEWRRTQLICLRKHHHESADN